MMMLSFEENNLKELIKTGISLEMVVLLKVIERGDDVEEYVKNSSKLENCLTTIIRKSLYHEGKLSLEGVKILEFLSSPTEGVKLVKKKPDEEGFNKWWNTYKATDSFTYKGKSFPGSRSLRVKKDDCKLKLNAILKEGEYTTDELISALELEIKQKMENSIKTGQNKLSYMKNSLTYLNQRDFEGFIDLIREGYKTKEVSTTSNETYI